MNIFETAAYRVVFDERHNALHFVWQENHPELSYEDFIEACCNFIGYGFEYQVSNIYINTRHFNYMPPAEFQTWQNTVHYDRYRKIGIQKVAYVMNAEHVEYMNNAPAPDHGFAIKYFDDATVALNWFLQ